MMSSTRSPRFVLAAVLLGAALFAAAVVAQQAPTPQPPPSTTTKTEVAVPPQVAPAAPVPATKAPPKKLPPQLFPVGKLSRVPVKKLPPRSLPALELPVVTVERGATAFLDVYRVLLHPRCMNCHPNGDVPLQTDNSIPHAMNIRRESRDVGLPCSTCHRETMPILPHQPPGLPTWHMPPKETPMVFQGKTPAQLCAQLKKPEETAGKDLDGLVHHVENDALVHYGWNPGPGRTIPPLSHEDFVLAFRTWVKAGAPCPHDDVRVDVKKSATSPTPR